MPTAQSSVSDSFDPLAFLAITVEPTQADRWRHALWQELAAFMLEQFVNSLNDEELEEVERVLPYITEYDLALRLIRHYRPNFDQLKSTYLETYKAGFNVDDFKTRLQL